MSDREATLLALPLSRAGAAGNGYRPFGRMILEVRLDMPAWKQVVAVACSIIIGMFISAMILVVSGVPPAELVSEFASNVFDRQSFQAVLVQAAPLILVGIAASIGFRARFWNLGLEGQMVWGGIAATAVSIYHVGPEVLRLPIMAIAAMLAGMAWVAIPALLRLRFAVNEIISTLLLNYVATYFLYDLLYGSWKDPVDAFPHSTIYASAERLPDIGYGVNAALPLALALVLVVWWYGEFSRFGFYLKFIYANPAMGRLVGVPIMPVVWTAVLMSGALAALGGFVVPSGIAGRLTQGFFEGYGFSGVLIAFLARNNAIAAAIVAVLIAMLFVTGQSFQIFYQIPFSMVQMIQAIIVMCVAASEFFIRHRIRWQR
ncbi:MAG TPA: ABC transporter permease [Xanthobacteraceae bacterium]|jgi:simple sugar transport system permease protein